MGRVAVILSFLRVTKNEAKQTDVKIDPGAGANVTAQNFSPAGDDSQPLPEDYALTTSVLRTGGEAVVGFVDASSEPVAGPGEVRRYAREAGQKRTVAEHWLKADGTAVIAVYSVTGDGPPILVTLSEMKSDGSTTLSTFEDGTVKVKVTTLADGTAKTENEKGSIELAADGSVVLTTPAGSNTFGTDGSVDYSNGAKINSTGDVISATGISLSNHTHIGNHGTPTSPPIP